MPRKFFRKYLPSHASIRENRYIARFGSWLKHHNLWHLHRRSVAGGVAAGMFAGLIPGSNPVQFTAAALLAIAFRVNLPIAAIVTLYSNPFTIVPLYYLAFKLGQLALLESNGELPPVALSFWRWVVALLCLLPLSLPHVRRDWPQLRAAWPWLLLFGALGTGGYNVLVYGGLQYTTAINGTLLNSFIPIMIVLPANPPTAAVPEKAPENTRPMACGSRPA